MKKSEKIKAKNSSTSVSEQVEAVMKSEAKQYLEILRLRFELLKSLSEIRDIDNPYEVSQLIEFTQEVMSWAKWKHEWHKEHWDCYLVNKARNRIFNSKAEPVSAEIQF